MFYKLWLVGVTARHLELLISRRRTREHNDGHVVWNQRIKFLWCEFDSIFDLYICFMYY